MCYISKSLIIDRMWTYSINYSQQLSECEYLFQSNHGTAALLLLFNVFENIVRAVLDDFDSAAFILFQHLRDNAFISDREYIFISDNTFSLRKIRNYFSHKHLSSWNLIVNEGGNDIFWSLADPDTSLLIYDRISLIVFNISYKIIGSPYAGLDNESENRILAEDLFSACDLKFYKVSSVELLRNKGFPENYLEDIAIPENDKIRLIENSPHLHIVSDILNRIVKSDYAKEDPKNSK